MELVGTRQLLLAAATILTCLWLMRRLQLGKTVRISPIFCREFADTSRLPRGLPRLLRPRDRIDVIVMCSFSVPSCLSTPLNDQSFNQPYQPVSRLPAIPLTNRTVRASSFIAEQTNNGNARRNCTHAFRCLSTWQTVLPSPSLEQRHQKFMLTSLLQSEESCKNITCPDLCPRTIECLYPDTHSAR